MCCHMTYMSYAYEPGSSTGCGGRNCLQMLLPAPDACRATVTKSPPPPAMSELAREGCRPEAAQLL